MTHGHKVRDTTSNHLSAWIIASMLIISACIACIGSWPVAEAGSAAGNVAADNGTQVDLAGANMAMQFFTENKGQFRDDVRFVATTGFGKALFYDSKVVLAMSVSREGEGSGIETVTYTFPGSQTSRPIGLEACTHRTNYLIGPQENWVLGAQSFKSIVYPGLWNGIDLFYKVSDGGMKYEFALDGYVEVDLIKVRTEGASLSSGGDRLYLDAGTSQLIDGGLLSFEGDDMRAMPTSFVTRGNEFGFSVPARDISQPLVIDPLIYSTYLGGQGEWGTISTDLEVDGAGNAYLVGYTTSPDFPPGDVFQTNFSAGITDAYLVCLSADGGTMLFSTFIGGTGNESAISVNLDNGGNIYISGGTDSKDFPVLNGYQMANGGGLDAFYLKLGPGGDALLYSTYLGGTGEESSRSVAIDVLGNIYSTGITSSVNFPLVNAFQSTKSGAEETFVLKLNASGNELDYSTFMGGSGEEYVYGLALDSAGCTYITGVTLSTDYPTKNAFQGSIGGQGDIFVTKLSANGTSLVFSTYIGVGNDETGHGIAVDNDGNVYVGGSTFSTNFPIVKGVQSTFGGGWSDGFLLKLSADGRSLVYSTYFGGKGNFDEGNELVIDEEGNAYMVGWTTSNNLQTVNPFQGTSGGGSDCFVIKMNKEGDALLFSTYIGGSDAEENPGSIVLDAKGNFYITGVTYSPDYPVFNAYQDHQIGSWRNGFVFKYLVPSPPLAVNNLTASAGDGQVVLEWQPPSDDRGAPVTNYRVYRGASSGNETSLVLLGNVTNFTDGPLSNGLTYFYKVSAVNSAGEGQLSDSVSATPEGPPSAPIDLVALAGDGMVNLSWSPPSYAGPGVLTYHLLRNGSEMWSGTGLQLTDAAVVNAVMYSYKVAANNSLGWGPNSTSVLAMPMPPDAPPTAPLGLSAVAGNSTLLLNWTMPFYVGQGSVTYHLFRDGVEIWSGAELEHLDPGLAKGTTYAYNLAAENDMGWGPNSSALSVTAVGVPDPAWGLAATPGDGSIGLSWHAVNYSGPGSLAYHIYRDGTEIWSGTGLSHVDSGLANGHAYAYAVAASNSIGMSVRSATVSALPEGPPTVPGAPSVHPGDSYIGLTWSAPSYIGPGALTYHLFRNNTLLWSGTAAAYNDTNVINGVAYNYKVAAENEIGWGPNSTVVWGVPVEAAVPPSAPQNLQAVAGDGEVTLTWQAPQQPGSSAITGYHVYRGTSSGGKALVATLGDVLTYRDAGLSNGQTYYYEVCAHNAAGTSTASVETSVVPVSSDTGGDDMTIVIAILALVVVVGAAGALLYMRRKK